MSTSTLPGAFRLDGARALVTGASRGIGRACALALAAAGADVALTARSGAALHGAAKEAEEHGVRAVALAADLAGPGAPSDVVDRAAAALGGLDVVLHNAGVLPTAADGSPVLVPFQHSTQEDWEYVIALNLNVTAELCRAAHPHLAASGRASLILMSSASGVMGTPLLDAYAATKAAQISLARSLGVGWAREGIRVNAVCPGWITTDMTGFASGTEAFSNWLMAHVPQGRWGSPEDVAGAVLFLASPASALVTAQALVLDGGLSTPDGGLAAIPKPPSPFAA
ncbi:MULTISPECIES: SDR family NAD(P)-dependent oxidoreductase [Kitasatospora]|uniref:Putative oxidoreductase n=1 Tax=Kitasatospora setae (strain ATCC 33774 / DSM 43861 / JCM 3304 / KCC A-0304 / NBRC 14216 / KM-6054) TaxID=452652 RepID=E4NJE0_KITSK|nr:MULTISPECIES: SDR family NAD(P)-dependent oxidoreductase [Kitasatospora]BAJ33088.1 putative oxidoreductase [Kitasatospora setae KM-6054]